MDGWSVALLAAAAYVAVTGLTRLMLARRDQLMQEVERQIAAQRQQQAAEEQQDQAA